MASRLERLVPLVQSDLDNLPNRPPSTISDDSSGGGVPLSVEPNETVPPTEHVGNFTEPFVEPAPNPLTTSFLVPEESPDRRFVWVEGAASSYNLGSAPKLSTLPAVQLPPTSLSKGQLAPAGYNFTPITALSKFPYKFCNRDHTQDIASAFFDANKFWNRAWDLYFVWDIDENLSKPLILVPESQVDQLLKEINSTLNLQVRITNQQREDGLVGRFPDHPRCTPRYLGRSHTKAEFENMVADTPSTDGGVLPTGRTLEDFKKLMEEMWDIQKNKSKAQKEKKKQEQIVKRQVLVQQFKRAQRYLGLRPSIQGVLASVDPGLPVPFEFDQSVVFICVDVESYERAHHKITEIGVATLDTRDLVGVAPGKDGENWRSEVCARHFRIKEHRHLINHDFVHGCPDRFEFGESEFVSLSEAPAQVASCFRPPFGKKLEDTGAALEIVMKNLDLSEQRNLIFLGHDTLTDVQYLQQLGFDPLKVPNMLESQDSAAMYRVWRREPQTTKLGRILADFDIPGWHLHNAGNDAVYTVQAMLAICVREATIRGSPALETKRGEDKAKHISSLTEEAVQRANDEAEGWSETEDNGGSATRIVIKEKASSDVVQNSSATCGGRGNPGRGRGRGMEPTFSYGPTASTWESTGDAQW